MEVLAPEIRSARGEASPSEAELGGARQAVAERGVGALVIDELTLADVERLGWSGSSTPLRAVARFLSRVACGDAEYLAVRGPAGSPVAKCAIDYTETIGAGTIVQLATHDALQGLGIGTALITYAEERIRRRGLTLARIGVEDENRRARALYERLGYTPVGRRRASWDSEAPDGSISRYETVLTLLEKVLVR